MKKITLIAATALFSFHAFAQDNDSFYATILTTHAKELKKENPDGIQIIQSKGIESAVLMTEEASHTLHQRILTHGPGFFYKPSKEEALRDLNAPIVPLRKTAVNFTITEDELVNEAIQKIDGNKIGDHIKELEAYGTRRHDRPGGKKSSEDLKVKWENMAKEYGRDDISVRLFNHNRSNMPSVILTMEGTDGDREMVVVGGHLDSTSSNHSQAPGADDDASGIATITEAYRALLEIDFKPERTIEFMAYSAEEVGLVGSDEIAKKYKQDQKNVIAVGQFDMTFYKGSARDIYFVNDYVSKDVTQFMKDLLDHYNKGEITYDETTCDYGCSDHASWTKQGYGSAFPFESRFGSHNSNIHKPTDNFNRGSVNHSVKFAKLCTEFLIETAKGQSLSVDEFSQEGYTVKVINNALKYKVDNSKPAINSIVVYNIEGKLVSTTPVSKKTGKVSLKNLSSGTYIAKFKLSNNRSFNKKFILN